MSIRSAVGTSRPSPLGSFRFVVFVLAMTLADVCAETPDFARQVRPLLEEHCFKCHGPDKQKSGLRLDTRIGAFSAADSGEKVIMPGHAKESRLIKRVSSKTKDERMPPKGEPLSSSQIELLKRWIDAGAELPEAPVFSVATTRSELRVTENDQQTLGLSPSEHLKTPRRSKPPLDPNPRGPIHPGKA